MYCMKKLLCFAIASMGALLALAAQDATIRITKGERPKMGASQVVMEQAVTARG